MLELRELQLCQLDVALEIKRICEKNNIPYFLIGGTLLGAVRHKGFIPWDDDLDIGFLRKDYERFIDVCKTDLSPDFFLQTWETDQYYGMPFGKVMINGTTFREAANGKCKAKSMIFVDIFPYDPLDKNCVKRKYQYLNQELGKKLLQYKQGYEMWQRSKHRNLHKFLRVLSYFVSIDFLKKHIYRAQTCGDNGNTMQVINYNGAYRDRELFEFCGIEILKFESYDFNVPKGWDQLLTNMYGDYMQLPPVEERGDRHKTIEADIGRYVIKNARKIN